MNYIENIYICLAAPVLVAVLCLQGSRRRMMFFFLTGMSVALLSSYINTFLAAVYGTGSLYASVEIAPVVEEVMKLLPVLLFLLLFEPDRPAAAESILTVSVGFATFENACYLIANGAQNITHLAIRGFGTGAMHVVCGALVGVGLYLLWDRKYARAAGLAVVLAIAVVYHGVYNILVSQTGAAAQIGYLIPVVTVVLWVAFVKRRLPKENAEANGQEDDLHKNQT